MQEQNNESKILLPHHEQQSLCTTRLPYRQGRELTAVKVYSITNESNHLLIFGVPSLNLRQEARALFIKFGKLLQFTISKEHACETFTETYHAQYEQIQSARLAKRMLDTKTFYGGALHVCYAPELENVNETRQKLIQRQRDVVYRLKNLHKENNTVVSTPPSNNISISDPIKLNMGEINTISIDKQTSKVVRKKRKLTDNKKFKPCFIDKKIKITMNKEIDHSNNVSAGNSTTDVTVSNITCNNVTVGDQIKDIEIVDCTGVDEEVITNINEHLNYNKFGNEIIRKVPHKPPNKIQFHINKKS